jgi:DNA ligase D-like protein (predicted 3'-phosphoesterase)
MHARRKYLHETSNDPPTQNARARPLEAKLDFSKTAEPSGENAVAPSEVRRFVMQKHAATRLHYDFCLELDGVLKSWAVTKGSVDDRSA